MYLKVNDNGYEGFEMYIYTCCEVQMTLRRKSIHAASFIDVNTKELYL